MFSFTPFGDADSYHFPFPEEIQKCVGADGMIIAIRDIFEMMAREVERKEPQRAELFRSVAAHYPHCDDAGYVVARDRNGNILPDFDDWDELSDAQKLTRGNINATIAVLDRLRFDLEKMNDNPENNAEVDEIRRGLAAIIDDRW